MAINEVTHTAAHEEQIRRLVEETLSGEEKQQAERNLLNCPECLAEYNWYRGLWRAMAGDDYFEQLESRLKAHNPARHALYAKTIAQLSDRASAEAPASAGTPWWSGLAPRTWKTVAATLAILLVLVIPVGLYKIYRLQEEIRHKDEYSRRLVQESERKDQSLLRREEAIRDLRNQLAARTAPPPAEPSGERRPISSAKDLRPMANAIFVVQFLQSRQAEDRPEIAVPSDKTFLNFQLRAASERDYPAYRLALCDAQGRTLWQDARAGKDKFGNFSLLLGKDFLAPGEYVLKVYGVDRGRAELLSQNPFRILSR